MNEKDSVQSRMTHRERAAIKKAAKGALKRHYPMMVILLVGAMLLGVAYTSGARIMNLKSAFMAIRGDIINLIHQSDNEAIEELEAKIPSDEKEGYISDGFTASDILLQIILGDYEQGLQNAQEIQDVSQTTEIYIGGVEVGLNRGLFATFLASFSSGAVYASIINTFGSVMKAPDAGSIVMVAFATALTFFIWFFLKRVYIVVYARIFLEGRTYKRTPIGRITFMIRNRKWLNVAVGLLWCSLWQFLWDLTIVGGIIKRYEYSQVPYILAENPGISAKDALNLSKLMMRGHKWELFVVELSFLPWALLDYITFGAVGIFFYYPYQEATNVEYYVRLRALAKEAHQSADTLLNDVYLYEIPADEVIAEAYQEVTDLIAAGIPEIPRRKGVARFFAEYLGVVLKNDAQEEEYRRVQAIHNIVHNYRYVIRGEVYPIRLCPLVVRERKKNRDVKMHYIRHYSLLNLLLIFFSSSLIGWIWEVTLHLVTDGVFVNRGILHGPILPIYGYGAVVSLMLLTKLRRSPVATFIGAIVFSGVLEYGTAWYLETVHGGQKWWDYTGYFLNLHGRICAEGLLVFGIACSAGIFVICPLLDSIFLKFKRKVLIPIVAVCLVIYLADNVYSTIIPNAGEGITDYQADIENEKYQIYGQYSMFKQAFSRMFGT